MSTLFSPDSVFLQRFLSSGGFYKGDLDGLIGPKSRAALGEFEIDTQQIADELGSFDKRTEVNIRTMLIPTQRAARKFMKTIAQAGLSPGFTVRILSGTRTFAEQAILFEKHQHGGPLAARPGRSNHNFGIAWDVGVFNQQGAYIDDLIDKKTMTSKAVDAEYKKAGAHGKAGGLFWGGDWSNPDFPHFQMRDNDDLASIRDAFMAGQPVV
ncbi:MAG: peptidoglycan LD-endopeptidase CwlK [Verrucomicrobiota bacterium]|jgi:peptidoglycan L-alanyl-D-glutamate endopeptidase CwlK